MDRKIRPLSQRKRPLKRTRGVQKTKARGVGELSSDLLAPLERQRSGLFSNLHMAWPEIVGEKLAQVAEPLRLDWPRRFDETDSFKPACLVLAVEPARALFIEADSSAILEKVNGFLGFFAIDRLKIHQQMGAGYRRDERKVSTARIKPNRAQRAAIEDKLEDMEDGPVKDALIRLGAAQMARRLKD